MLADNQTQTLVSAKRMLEQQIHQLQTQVDAIEILLQNQSGGVKTKPEPNEWEYGFLGTSANKARRHRLTGEVQMYQIFDDYWIDTTIEYWKHFKPNN